MSGLLHDRRPMRPASDASRGGRERSAPHRAARLATLAATLVLLGACATSPDPDADVRADPVARAERIAGLRASIDRDHAVLKELIARERTSGEVPAHEDPRIREIAARLTDRTRRLERLEADAAPGS